MRSITSVLSHSKRVVSPTHGFFNSSGPFLSTRSYLNGHPSSSATMIFNRRLTTRPGLAPLRQSNLLQTLLLKRSCQSYARPGRVGPPRFSSLIVADNCTSIRYSRPIRECLETQCPDGHCGPTTDTTTRAVTVATSKQFLGSMGHKDTLRLPFSYLAQSTYTSACVSCWETEGIMLEMTGTKDTLSIR